MSTTVDALHGERPPGEPEGAQPPRCDQARLDPADNSDRRSRSGRDDKRYVEIHNLIKAYPNPTGDPIKVVDRFNLTIKKGEVISVIGHSGCGKSTVLTMTAGLNDITSGSVIVAGREVTGPGPDRAVVFQAPCLLPWMSSMDNVLLGVNQVYPHAAKAERRDIAAYYLNLVGLADAMGKHPREMSGGMQQRVGIARAIALKPKLLLLDEPFGRLDSLTRMDLQDVILDILAEEKITTMVITHDVDEAVYMADRICMMTNGPRARVGQILEIPFERPRVRREVINHDLYYDLRAALIDFLETFEQHKGGGYDDSAADSALAAKLRLPPAPAPEGAP